MFVGKRMIHRRWVTCAAALQFGLDRRESAFIHGFISSLTALSAKEGFQSRVKADERR
jgi:hypothetical protein